MKKYKCMVCGQVVEVEDGEPCPICGAGPECLEPVEDEEEK
ncbi:MAG: rubredoxin [Bacilli bacterium]|nr:rubredoxin [Bacilli bacterium]